MKVLEYYSCWKEGDGIVRTSRRKIANRFMKLILQRDSTRGRGGGGVGVLCFKKGLC